MAIPDTGETKTKNYAAVADLTLAKSRKSLLYIFLLPYRKRVLEGGGD
jgi:hypothetical protein